MSWCLPWCQGKTESRHQGAKATGYPPECLVCTGTAATPGERSCSRPHPENLAGDNVSKGGTTDKYQYDYWKGNTGERRRYEVKLKACLQRTLFLLTKVNFANHNTGWNFKSSQTW